MKKTNSSFSLGIVGCGWLGYALAQKAIQQNVSVVATSQNAEKLVTLEQEGICSHQLILPFENSDQHYPVFDCEVLIICITPQFRQGKKDYPDKIKQLVLAAQQGAVKRIVLISTTAAYEGLSGEVDEQSELCLEDEKVSLINKAEQYVLAFSDNSIVLRCAGLVGPNRHPGKFFNADRRLKSANAFVNLVHQYDVVELLLLLSKANIGGLYNCVSDMQVNKKTFYQHAAKALDKTCPMFEENDNDTGRLVLGNKLRESLSYQYKFDDLIMWLSAVETKV
ncbi:NAD(P)-binding domain-containing protein [Thalassotalea marina]|uniref:NAD(P)-dependent oxidoreductase n=1 Tax=Thalassotalea marina TaxID=1673741 RepID=A0A919BDT2_9GAMM|nr:NAD(P)-binding domain-containing protein [Thalassotalea marina]GHF82248.1 NAD(P)-dependent oxidoreductase [Thalassotalea marina]